VESFDRSLNQFMDYANATDLFLSKDDYEKRKIRVFNQLNLFQLLTGLLLSVILVISEDKITPISGIILFFPPMISLLVLHLNARQNYTLAQVSYFILYPFFTSLIYLNGMSLGIELNFVLYGILSVFFIQQLSHILFSIGFNMVNYFIVAVVLNSYLYELEQSYRGLYLFNQLLAIGYIFYGLYLIRNEYTNYRLSILEKNRELEIMNEQINRQKQEISEKAKQLEAHTAQLNEVDRFKNRLFSIVSHDLKNPLYSLRNLFYELKEQRISAREMNNLIPVVVKDLNYVTGLTDNLLHWARSQMHSQNVNRQIWEISNLVEETVLHQRLQSEMKNITISMELKNALLVYADRDMVSLVLRNLISNAIKFTPADGKIMIGVNDHEQHAEIFVVDSGTGMNEETLSKIRRNNYYTTKGTANESGTGLGLMLVKEFLSKNEGHLHIESREGEGSTFSFTLPKPVEVQPEDSSATD